MREFQVDYLTAFQKPPELNFQLKPLCFRLSRFKISLQGTAMAKPLRNAKSSSPLRN